MISRIRRKNFPADFFEDNREWLNINPTENKGNILCGIQN